MALNFVSFSATAADTDPSLTESRPCPVCGSSDIRAVMAARDVQFYSDGIDQSKRVDVHQVQCRHCLALYMNPAYTDRGFM